MMRTRWAIAGLLALAACSESVDSVPEVEKSDHIANTATPPAAEKLAPKQADASPRPAAPAAPAAVAMPKAYRGRWALVPADCEPGRADAKGLMTIEPDRIRFYESRARVVSVTETTPTSLTAGLDLSGEGQTWQESTRFTLSGASLKRETHNPDLSLTYQRCPT